MTNQPGAWVARPVLFKIRDLLMRDAPLETGGLLLGYWSAKSNEVCIVKCTGPGPNARHTRISYHPDYDHDVRAIAREYQASGRTVTYLGEWHTHPCGQPAMSRIDKNTLRRISRFEAARIRSPLMFIGGTGHSEDSLTIAAYSLLRKRIGPFKYSTILRLNYRLFDA